VPSYSNETSLVLEDRGSVMKAFIVGVAAIVFAIIGMIALDSVQQPADRAFSTSAVQLEP
jgi:hypothetical protein